MPSRSNRAAKRTLTLSTGAAAAFVTLRFLSRPLAGTKRELLDWDQVRNYARGRAVKTHDERLDKVSLGHYYDGIAAELAPLMTEVCQSPLNKWPTFSVLDRHEFIEVNLAMARTLMQPLETAYTGKANSRLGIFNRRISDRYVGELFGLLANRVLGQYDPKLHGIGSSLYIVEPNLDAFIKAQNAPPTNLQRWLVLHELTHAWQFENHPWLKEHITGLINQLLGSSKEMLTQRSKKIRGFKQQLETAKALQAVMSVCEGYGNFVMHEVGRKHIADFDKLDQAFHRRSKQQSLLERVVFMITGMNLKLKQYTLGEQFAKEVTRQGGLQLLNQIWQGSKQMPTLAELKEPQLWIARLG